MDDSVLALKIEVEEGEKAEEDTTPPVTPF